jgi:hypothetical protein
MLEEQLGFNVTAKIAAQDELFAFLLTTTITN